MNVVNLKTSGKPSIRPSSAPAPDTVGLPSTASTAKSQYTAEEQQRVTTALQGSLVTQVVTSTGVPAYTVPAVVVADLLEGSPMRQAPPEGEAWRASKVQTYVVPPHPMGFGEGGARPFHQDYRHYKYYGFAGRGAKTSWGHNPKANE